MATIHTAYGEGEVVEVEHGRMGKTRYKVAGYGFEMWLDATDPAIHTAGEDVFSYAPEVEMMGGHHIPGTPSEAPHFGGGHNGNDAWGMGHEGSNIDFGETNHSWDNSTTLPYRWEPKNPVEMYNHEQTISPDHELGYSPEERTRSSDSVTGEDRSDEHDYPGPAPHLFADKVAWTFHDEEDPNHVHEDERWSQHNDHAADVPHVAAGLGWTPGGGDGIELPPQHRAPASAPSWQDHVNTDALHLQDQIGNDTSNPAHPNHVPPPRHGAWERPAGLSAKFADVHEAFNPNDPADQFRLDPDAAIRRHASFDRDAGLDPGTGQEQLLLPSDHQILRTAAWRDVRDKAVRIVREGGVHVEAMDTNAIYANVDGDHGTYECMILTGAAYPNGGFSGGKQAIANWKCDCEWGKWAFKRKFTFVGRLCSHGYATYLTQASHNAKHDPNHGFRKRKKRSSLDDFKSWAKDENGGHIDSDAADNYLSSTEEPVTREDAEKILDYVETNHSEHPERDYDVKGYHYDNDTEVLQHQPGKLTPHLYEIVERDEDKRHYFTDLGDDRKTTGPDQIQANRDIIAQGGVSEHHPAFAWHTDDHDDFPDSGIVHFSSLHLVADEDLLNRLRTMSEQGPAEHPHGAEAHNHEVSNVVDELHDRGYDAAPLVAMKRAALQRLADGQGDSVDPNGLAQAMGIPNAQIPKAPNPVDQLLNADVPGQHAPLTPTGPPDPTGGLLSGPLGQAGPTGASSAHPGGSGSPGGVGTPGGAPAAAAAASGGAGVQPDGGWKPSTDNSAISGPSYDVKGGDTLSGIADRAHVGLGDLEKSNTQISNPDLIHPGDKVNLPGGGGAAGRAGPDPNINNSADPFRGIGPQMSMPNAPKTDAANSPFQGIGPQAQAPHAPSPTGPGGMPSGGVGSPGSGLKTVGPTPAAPKSPSIHGGAQRFAELYFHAADDDPSEGDDKKPSSPPAPATNQGDSYKQLQPTDPQQPRPSGLASGVGMGADAGSTASPNPLGAPAAGSIGVSGPKGVDSTTGGAPGQQQGHPQQQQQHPGGGLQHALGIAENIGGMLGGLPVIGPALGGVTNALSGLGGLAGGLGHLGAKDFAARYFEADGTFGGEGGGDWMDHSFAGSGPDRQNWSTTSESWLDEHEKGIRDETWVTDLDGDVAAYTTKRPKQSNRRTAEGPNIDFGGVQGNEAPHSAVDGGPHGFPGMGGFGLGDGSGSNGPKITPIGPGTSVASRFAEHYFKADGGMLGGGDAGYGSTGGMAGGTLSTGGSGEDLGGSFTHAEGSSGAPTMGTLTNTAGRTANDAWHPSQTGFHNPRNPGPFDVPNDGPKMPKPKRAPNRGAPSANEAPSTPNIPLDEDDASSASAGLLVGARDTDGSDIVRMFQASGAGCVTASAGSSAGHSDGDIAEQASRMLRTAGRNYSLAEQRELEDEEPVGGRRARNFGDLDLRGTHYEE